MTEHEADLCLLHFNDVYHAGALSSEPVGGAARFLTLLKECRSLNPVTLTVFSGDAFHPSLESAASKGKHMVPVLNSLDIDAAVYGNHDFDFGVAELLKRVHCCNFPWLLSNVYDASMGEPLAKGREYVIIERNGLKIGLIGLVEREWLDTLRVLPPDIEFRGFVETGRRLFTKLTEENHVDLVIALTHMRLPNDQLLAEALPQIMFICGGHDHFYKIENPRGKQYICKSGTDFRDLSCIRVWFEPNGRTDEYGQRVIERAEFQRLQTFSSVEPNPELHDLVEKQLAALLDTKTRRVVARIDEPLDARSENVRLRESNIGNLASDIVRHAYETDVGFLCGGTIRSDRVINNVLTVRDVLELFPFEDPVVIIELTGEQLLRALENGFGSVPKQEGRFPQLSGLLVKYDSCQEPGKRVVSVHMQDNGQPLNKTKKYRVATREYLAQGRDGYIVFKEGRKLLDDENGCLLSQLFRRFCLGLKYVEVMRSFGTDDNRSQDSPARSRGWRTLKKLSHRLGSASPKVKICWSDGSNECRNAIAMFHATSCAASTLPEVCGGVNGEDLVRDNRLQKPSEAGPRGKNMSHCISTLRHRSHRNSSEGPDALSKFVPTIRAAVEGRIVDVAAPRA